MPLLYEGRHVEEDVDEAAIDAWFDRVTRDLSDEQMDDLKRRMSRPREMMGVARPSQVHRLRRQSSTSRPT